MTSEHDDCKGASRADIKKIIDASGKKFRARLESLEDMRRKSRKLFTNYAGEPILRRSIVTYLDELGTSERLSEYGDLELREDLGLYDRTRVLVHDDLMYDSDLQRSLYFSDNLVTVEPINLSSEEDPHPEMFSQLISVAAYQLNLAIRGRFLRGGITVGPAYADLTFVTGPAHLKAVQLEEVQAKNPRVLLDESGIEIAISGIRDLSPDEQLYGDYLLVDEDGDVFVNYLMAVFEDEGFVNAPTAESGIKRHRVAVEDNLRKYSSTKVFEKYRWVARYHNHFVKSSRFNNRKDLLIESEVVGQFVRFTKADLSTIGL